MLLQKMNSTLNKLTNEVKNQTIQTNEEKSFMLIFQDIDQFYNNLNLSNETLTPIFSSSNCSVLNSTNNSLCDFGTEEFEEHFYNYWALILILFPIFTLFGNVLVILSVYRERTLQSATNYFIVSLAVADLLVAVVVMPFAVYVLVNGAWALPGFVCDFYIAMDVTCSTSSIFNLVAISIDRYIAVTQPIKYAKHKNNRRIWLTIALVWMISAAIGSPIVLGLNNTPERIPDACLFYNSDFIIYSSLSSFYIPCSIMVFLYYSIFKALKLRAMQSRLNRKPMAYEIKQTSNKNEISPEGRRVLAETTLGPISTIDEQATNTGSGSGEEEEEVEQDCHLISNERSTEFILATVVEEAAGNQNLNYDQVISSVVASLATPAPQADPNGNNDSGYAPSQTEVSDSPKKGARHFFKKNGASPSSDLIRLGTKTSNASETSAGSKKDKKATSAPRFTIYKVNKASKKKREKSSAKKERKATKTLAIVLGVFLFCWMPFFTCNILDAMCSKLNLSCQPGVAAFLLTTWLGYMNSFVNPVIYTIFNPEFRKAFKKIMRIGP